MSGTYLASMGQRGRIVVPAELRERVGLRAGLDVVFIETPQGVLMLTPEQLRSLVRADLKDKNLVESLLNDRRAAAHSEDAQ